MNWTPEMMEEYFKCKNDIIYFVENYMKILVKGKGLQPFLLFDYQKEMLLKLVNNRFNVFGTARQIGKSTIVSAYVLWIMIFSTTKPFIGFIANKQDTSIEVFSKVKTAYENIPLWLQNGVVEWNKKSITLENGSRAICVATSSDSVRGFSFDILFVDECAFIDNWEEFWPSTYNTITSSESTRAILVSTPNGLNHFYEIWSNAEKGISEWMPSKVVWHQVPGRDEKWKQTTLAGLNFDLEKFNQEHMMEFMGSSGTLISGWKLKELEIQIPFAQKEGFKQFEKPQKNHFYVLSADCGEGKGLDYSAFQVIDVTEKPFRQVATYRNNIITPVEYADFIFETGTIYNNASVLVELNAIGSVITHILYNEKLYDNMIMTELAGPEGKKVSQGFSNKKLEIGIRTTKTVKGKGCSLLKMLIEQNQLIVNESDTIYELSRFSRKGKSWEAEEKCSDDLVMSLVIFSWLTNQEVFKELTNIDILNNLRNKSEKQIMEELAPFGYISDGINQPEQDLLGKNNEGWVLDNDRTKKTRIFF